MNLYSLNDPIPFEEVLLNISDKSGTVFINPLDFSPGFIIKMDNRLHQYHYYDISSLPKKPEHIGNSRFNEEWFREGGMEPFIEVETFIKFKDHWFMVLKKDKDIHIPMNSKSYPLTKDIQYNIYKNEIIIGSFLINNLFSIILNDKLIVVQL